MINHAYFKSFTKDFYTKPLCCKMFTTEQNSIFTNFFQLRSMVEITIVWDQLLKAICSSSIPSQILSKIIISCRISSVETSIVCWPSIVSHLFPIEEHALHDQRQVIFAEDHLNISSIRFYLFIYYSNIKECHSTRKSSFDRTMLENIKKSIIILNFFLNLIYICWYKQTTESSSFFSFE